MRGKWGTIWLAAAMITVALSLIPLTALAADSWQRGGMPLTLVGGQTAGETQMLGEKPFQTQPTPNAAAARWSGTRTGWQLDQDGGAALKLPYHLEMDISVHYSREYATVEPPRRRDSLFMKSSLDYRLLPNLKVGLNSYLYRPDQGDSLSSLRSSNDLVMGLGPGLKYDLGRWSFLLKTQVETGQGDRGDLQNTLRIWYAF